LKRNVEELAELGQLGAGLDQPFGEVPRVRRGEADAFDAGNVVDVAQEISKSPSAAAAAVGGGAREVAAVGVDVLSQESNFFVPRLAAVVAFFKRENRRGEWGGGFDRKIWRSGRSRKKTKKN
jgi:hypothetical protein